MLIKYIFLFIFLLICVITDVKRFEVNSFICLFFALAGMILCFLEETSLAIFLLSLAPGLFLLLLCLLIPEKIGAGDSIMILVCGVYLGCSNVISLLFISCIFSALYSIYALLKKHRTLSYKIPFAPFIFLGYITEVICIVKV